MFNTFPQIVYPLTKDGAQISAYTLTDILTRTKFNMGQQDLRDITMEFKLDENMNPELASNRLYGTPFYHWTILFVNNMFDYITDWYMNDEQIIAYCEDKYTDPYGDHFYIDTNNTIVGNASTTVDAFQSNASIFSHTKTPILKKVSAYEYELMKNENKKFIRVIRPDYIEIFVSKFTESVKSVKS